jgi:hypothetical protein
MCPDLMFDFFSPIYLMRDTVLVALVSELVDVRAPVANASSCKF